jgi:hypothetical protein
VRLASAIESFAEIESYDETSSFSVTAHWVTSALARFEAIPTVGNDLGVEDPVGGRMRAASQFADAAFFGGVPGRALRCLGIRRLLVSRPPAYSIPLLYRCYTAAIAPLRHDALAGR